MSVINARCDTFRARGGIVFSKGQFALLFLLLGICIPLIFATIQQATLNAIVLLGFVSVGGLVLCRNTQVHLNDPSLRVLGYFWLIKLGLTIFLLYAGWMPQLDPATSDAWGYDPQRYYIQAQELVDNNWSPDFVSLNYVGILYYYGAIYYVLGHNPVIPALFNAFVTLIAALYLVRVGYEIKGQKGPRDWTLAFALLLPEVLWYDVMTSREMLTAALLLFAMLTAGRYLARTAPVSLSKVLIIVGLSSFSIAAVRTSMLLPVIASIVLMVLLVFPQRGARVVQRTILVVAAAAILIAGSIIAGFNIGATLQVAFSASENVATISGLADNWSDNSIGLLLMPEGLLQSILFLLPRMLLYLVAPLPKVYVSVSNLLAGSREDWGQLLTLPSSMLNIFVIPYALASLVQSIKTRKANAAPLIFHISYWVTFMAIAGGNLIIHERYRVMATMLLWGCAWLGAVTCSKSLIHKTSVLWYGLLTVGALFYLSYKFV